MNDQIVLFRSWHIEEMKTRSAGTRERIVDAVIVPYGMPATVTDIPGHPYREEFAPGVFDEQLRKQGAPGRVWLRWQHDKTILSQLGKGVSFESHPDHLRGKFHVFDGAVGDQALAILESMTDLGVSVGFVRGRSTQNGDVLTRQSGYLRECSLTPMPAYPESRVLAVRDGHLIPVEDEQHDPPPTPAPPVATEATRAILERLEGMGTQ